MDLSNINFYMFLEFPGILITAGVVCLLISIIIIIVVYISEKKQETIKATELSPNYGYIPENEVNYPQANYTPNQSVIPQVELPNNNEEPQIDAFEAEFGSNNEVNNDGVVPIFNTIKSYINEQEENKEEKNEASNFDIDLKPLPEREDIKPELPEIKIDEQEGKDIELQKIEETESFDKFNTGKEEVNEVKEEPEEDFGLPKFGEGKTVSETQKEEDEDEVELL